MKTLIRLFFVIICLCCVLLPTYADRSENARVIKFDEDQDDLIVERLNGERWLIQHNRQCRSMNTEFPVTLILSGDKITQLKVNFNELCKVYNSALFSGEAKLTDLIRSENMLVTNHEGVMEWDEKIYRFDYGQGCPYFWDFLDKRIYLSMEDANSGKIILPSNRGQCDFTFISEAEVVKPIEVTKIPDSVKGIDYQAQNNQVYFYWENDEKENLLYLLSYSKFKLDTNDYHWKEMPNLIPTKRNSFTIRRLMNGRTYYFYISSVNEDGVAGPWTEVEATPVADKKIINRPDPEEFEIEVEETDTQFHLTWPDKENARRYISKFYINGKLETLKILKEGVNEYFVEKRPEYLNKRLRFTITSISRSPYGQTYYDGHFWVYRSDSE